MNSMSYIATCLHDLRTNIEELEDQFSDMQDCILDTIKASSITVQDFKDRLINLNVRNKDQHREFLDSQIFSEISAESINDIWRKLSDYSDFLNYTLIEHIIKKFGDQGLLEKMKAYKRKLEIFRSKTHLCDFVVLFKDITKCKEVLKKSLNVKFNEYWETCTLQDMERWKEGLTQKLLLPSFTVNLKELSIGCVSITWTIPTMFTTTIVEKLETLDPDMTDFCKEYKIVCLTFDGAQYLPVMEVPYTSASIDLYKDTRQFSSVYNNVLMECKPVYYVDRKLGMLTLLQI